MLGTSGPLLDFSRMRKNFVQYSKVFPLTKYLGFKVPSKWYRLVVGWMEVACGTTLLLIPGFAKQVANILLLVVMLGAFYSHVMLSEKFERMAPSIVFSLMLCCRLVVFWQIKRKERKALEKLAAQKTTSYAAKPDEAVAGPSKETKVD